MASPVESTILVIFGSMGDLTWRKLAPALYNLLFMRADQVEASWSVLMPILNVWEKSKPPGFPNYKSGTWGPKAAEALIAKDGRSWLVPTLRDVHVGDNSQSD